MHARAPLAVRPRAPRPARRGGPREALRVRRRHPRRRRATSSGAAIEAALWRAPAGNKSRAAKELGISRFALQRKLDKYGLGGGQPGDDGPADDVIADDDDEGDE